MFSANNFYQWTYETYLKDNNFTMLTYHPFGTRGYKNLQKWDLSMREGSGFDSNALDNAQVLMNDQEPVFLENFTEWKKTHVPELPFGTILDIYDRSKKQIEYYHNDNDKKKWAEQHTHFEDPVNHFLSSTTDKTFASRVMFPGIFKPIIVHSELRSPDIQDISDEFVPVYVFWHGLVSRDWYRHWRLDKNCNPDITRADNDHRFLLYARAWTGTREYRLKFVEKIIENNLHSSFKYNFFETDNNTHYSILTDVNINEYFPKQEFIKQESMITHIIKGHSSDTQKPGQELHHDVTSDSSAYIDIKDYKSTAIQIVAETLFDTEKIHLTEKTFQPIVAGQPFLTLSAPGTLEVLRYYGFHTFDHVWDESYDTIKDPGERMTAVLEQIKKLNSLSKEEFKQVYEKCLAVCEHNRQHFFSDRFEQQMLTEYDHNFKRAFEKQKEYAKENPGGSRFWVANEYLTKIYKTDFFYEQDQFYLRWILDEARNHSEEQYQAILEQYWWAKKLVNS